MQKNNNTPNTVIIFMSSDAADHVTTIGGSPHICYFGSPGQGNYYSVFFEVLKQLFPDSASAVQEICDEFQKRQETMLNIPGYTSKADNLKDELLGVLSKKSRTRKLIELACISTIITLITFAVWIIFNPLESSRQTIANQTQTTNKTAIVSELEKFLSDNKGDNFSSDNMSKEQMQKNYSLARQFETITEHLDTKELQAYFNSPEFTPEKLITFLYNIHALANYYTYHEHNGEKAHNLLKHGENIIENYLGKRNNLSVDFDKLNGEEIYTELSVIKDLPEIYTRIVYSLGRTFIYNGKSADGIRYFELSKYLGNRLGLFEGYLSSVSGIGIIMGDEADAYIKNKNYEAARKKLQETISLYKEHKNDNREYKLDYRSANIGCKTIIPKQDTYGMVERNHRIARNYTKLISITDDIGVKKEYAQEVFIQFTGDDTSPGILSVLKKIPDKKIAAICNSLGYMLLTLYDQGIDFESLKKPIITELALILGNEKAVYGDSDLEIIEYVFKTAMSRSRSADFTKADAYDGLIKVYQSKIDKGDLSQEVKVVLVAKITELTRKRDEINARLKRTKVRL